MGKKVLKIVSISSEVAPFSKTGGLADVARSLPKAISRLDHEVIVITPFYGKIISKTKHKLKEIFHEIKISVGGESVLINYWQGYLMEGLPVYFIEQKDYFSSDKKLYGAKNDNARFYVFDVAALKLLELLEFKPDIIHCHDWQTGLIPQLLNTQFKKSAALRGARTVFTIHNLVFQYGHNWWQVPANKKDFGIKKLPSLNDPDIEYINFAKRAILQADIINTVSEQYRQEIMTRHFGQDLHRILRNRADRLFGIINGIDHFEYNPSNDDDLPVRYDWRTAINGKAANKKYLQEKLGLQVDEDVPLICATSRITFQKGFSLIMEAMEWVFKSDAQIIVLGDGDKEYLNKLKFWQKKHPKRMAIRSYRKYPELESLFYAASDCLLLPSHHEPCGINQLIAMRYGCVPIVRNVGGLNDTVSNYNPRTNRGTGFMFNTFTVMGLYTAMIRALENYRYQASWQGLIRRDMKMASSWKIPAQKYLNLYRRALK
ncbi:MAG TPA: glycogen/starch synthase [bacterium]|nr:glycogen/starch synthase [bacterium]